MNEEKRTNIEEETKVETPGSVHDELLKYEDILHRRNQKRIRVGLRCLFTIPMFFLVLLLITDSEKVIFLILWIVSLFGIAVYLIYVEYADFKMQALVSSLCSREVTSDQLIGQKVVKIEDDISVTVGQIEEKKRQNREMVDRKMEEKREQLVKLVERQQAELSAMMASLEKDDKKTKEQENEDIEEEIKEVIKNEFVNEEKEGTENEEHHTNHVE